MDKYQPRVAIEAFQWAGDMDDARVIMLGLKMDQDIHGRYVQIERKGYEHRARPTDWIMVDSKTIVAMPNHLFVALYKKVPAKKPPAAVVATA